MYKHQLQIGSILVSAIYLCLVVPILGQAEEQSPRGLFQISVDGERLVEITPRSKLCYGSARYSNRGDKIVFDAWDKNQSFTSSRVFVANANGTQMEELTVGALPSWSPDDKQIAFRTYRSVNGSTIVVMNIDGTGRERLPINANCPRWSPNGRYIAFQSRQLGFFDAATAVKTHVRVELTGEPRWGGDWSPDGKYFGLPCVTPLEHEIILFQIAKPFAAIKPRTLVAGADIGCNIDWSPDGKHILFFQRKNQDDLYQIYTIATDTIQNPTPKLLPGQPRDRNNTDPTWAPDGKTIMFCSGTP